MNLVTLHTKDGQQYEAEYGDEGFTFINLGLLSNAFIETVGGAHIAVDTVARMEGLREVREDQAGGEIGCWRPVTDGPQA